MAAMPCVVTMSAQAPLPRPLLVYSGSATATATCLLRLRYRDRYLSAQAPLPRTLGRRVTHRHQHALELAERGQAFRPVLAADSRALEAAERRAHVEGVPVDPVGPGPHLLRDLVAAVDILRPDRPGEPVVAVVGHVDGLLDRVVGDDRQDRPEDLLLGDRHLVVDVGENRRLDVPADVEVLRAAATEHQPGTFCLAL